MVVVSQPLNHPTSLLALFFTSDEAGFEMEEFCWRCRDSTRLAGGPWQHFCWRF